jgi:hypothetical protein
MATFATGHPSRPQLTTAATGIFALLLFHPLLTMRMEIMKTWKLVIPALVLSAFPHSASASQASTTSITITGQAAGVTPFISKLNLSTSEPSVLKSIQFTIRPKTGSVTRALSATYLSSYLEERGYLNLQTGQITLPVFGLYANYPNTVTLTYSFIDGSSKQASIVVPTTNFVDPCGFNIPTVLQARTQDTDLSYDYILLKSDCSPNSPTIIDTDGAIRWVGTAGATSYSSTFFDNAVYVGNGGQLLRMELDGTIRLLAPNYRDIGITDFHHNIDYGKYGIILDANTPSFMKCVNIEVDRDGKVLKTWDLAKIISATMIAGGDDPSQFVLQSPDDWFHNNAVTYRKSDNSIIISSRENFLVCLDYETSAIKWILGDPTKKWYQYPSLRKYALAVAPGGVPPIGQHSPSITHDNNLLLFDDGAASDVQIPSGAHRNYAAPRKYQLDLQANVAKEIWNYTRNQSVSTPYCGSVYEDVPFNYLIDYALVGGSNQSSTAMAEIVGLDASGKKIFDYRYPTQGCETVWNAIPVHLERLVFPTATPPPTESIANISSRGIVKTNDEVMIGGFIITGNAPKTVVIRGLGPSLQKYGINNAITDPTLELYNSQKLLAQNDDYVPSPKLTASGLTPTDRKESAILMSLIPGSYTAILKDKNNATGVGLIEIYDLEQNSSQIANMSTRARVEGSDNPLIGGLIIKNNPTRVLIRALGPSLAQFGIASPLQNPKLELHNQNGDLINQNDDWQSNQELEIRSRGLSLNDPREAAIITTLPTGSYTAVVENQDTTAATNGLALLEIYDVGGP